MRRAYNTKSFIKKRFETLINLCSDQCEKEFLIKREQEILGYKDRNARNGLVASTIEAINNPILWGGR